jgi:hypothetical protein
VVLNNLVTGSGTGVKDSGVALSNIPRLDAATVFKPASNSTTAFQVQPSASTTPVLNVDTTNGRVGIKTASPWRDLTIAGSIGLTNSIFFDAAGSYGISGGTTGVNLHFQRWTGSANATWMYLASAGEVGIGKVPGSGVELDVNGDIAAATLKLTTGAGAGKVPV